MAQDMLRPGVQVSDEHAELQRAHAHYARVRDQLEAEAYDQDATMDVENGLRKR
jgi:hypothetical protein